METKISLLVYQIKSNASQKDMKLSILGVTSNDQREGTCHLYVNRVGELDNVISFWDAFDFSMFLTK